MKIFFQKILLSKKIKYTRHVKNRMRWRKISQKEINLVLQNPDEIKRIVNKKYSCFKTIDKRIIKIVFIIEDDQILLSLPLTKPVIKNNLNI